MKKKEVISLRTKKASELEKMVKDKKVEIVMLYADLSVGKEKNFKKIRNIKRDIAQMLTIETEMKIIEKEGLKKVVETKK